MSIFRPAEGNWYIVNSSNGNLITKQWGKSGDIPVSADYDGDGKSDIAVFRPSEGNWYIKLWTGSMILRNWGASTDIPVPGDFDGDGKADTAVFRPGEGTWYVINSSTNSVSLTYLGESGDVPVPAAYLPQ